MKKTFKMIELDCAHCAAKMQDAIQKLDGVEKVSVNFLTQKMVLEADDQRFDEILEQAVKACKKVDPDCDVER